MMTTQNSRWNRFSVFLFVLAYGVGYGLYVAQKFGRYSAVPDLAVAVIPHLLLPFAAGMIVAILAVLWDLIGRNKLQPLGAFNFGFAGFVTLMVLGELLELLQAK